MRTAHSLELLTLLVAISACTTGKPMQKPMFAGNSPAAAMPLGTPSTGSSASTSGAAGSTSPARSGGGGAATATGSDASAPATSGRRGAKDAAAPDAGESAASAEPRGTGPGDWVAGDYPADTQTYLEIKDVPGQMGNTREYKVHVPPSYDPHTPMPVVFCIHGLGQDATMFCVDGAGMPAKADAAHFILVMPNGYQNSWNGGTCCGGAASAGLDDIGLMRAIFKEVSGHLNIDLSRVYATGLSNGGYMSYRLACEAADLFVAVAPGSGAIGMDDIGGGTSTTGDFKDCKPSKSVSVLDFHGTQDGLVPYSLQKPSLERIATAAGCKLTTHAATQPASGGDTTCVTYDDCPSGIDISACSVMGGGHDWFGSDNCGTGVAAACAIVGANSDTLKNTDSAWEFFSAHAR
jgi:polyhydroxybutyrate depolymerase